MKKFEIRESITLENEGGRLFGILHRPLTAGPFPVVFFFHGFAGNKCGRHRIYVNLAARLSQFGIASFRMDFRGSGDSDGELIDMTLESEVSDALVGLKYLESLSFLDCSRLGIFGRSLGGAVAVLTATRYKKAKSMALWAPVFHAHQWADEWQRAQAKLKNLIPEDHAMRIHGHIAGKEFVHQLFEMDIEKELNKLEHMPLLHIHGDKDMTVTLDHAEKYSAHRQKVKAESRFVRVPHGDHDFTLIEAQRHAIEETSQWFSGTL